MTGCLQLLQSFCFPCGAAEAAGAGRRARDVGPAAAAAATALLVLNKWPALFVGADLR